MNRGIPGLRWLAIFLLAVCALSRAANASAQVTTGGISGVVTDADKPVAGASILAIHEPSGTTYDATTRADGRFSILGMRVGGPYSVQAVYVGSGNAFEPKTVENIVVNLGSSTDVNISVRAIAVTENVTVTADTDPVFASSRTGAATQVTRSDFANLPTISGRISDFTRLTPQSSGKRDGRAGYELRAGRDRQPLSCSASGIRSISSQSIVGSPGREPQASGPFLARQNFIGRAYFFESF